MTAKWRRCFPWRLVFMLLAAFLIQLGGVLLFRWWLKIW